MQCAWCVLSSSRVIAVDVSSWSVGPWCALEGEGWRLGWKRGSQQERQKNKTYQQFTRG